MTDGGRSQEAEDVSLRLVGDKDLLRDTLHGIVDCVDREGELYDELKALRWLARLVREGQIRELAAALLRTQGTAADARVYMYERIRALRQEG